MTQIVMLGNSGTGKTAFMITATGQRMPYNVFRSTHVETFHMGSAVFTVVPGNTSCATLRQACEGADGIIVLFTQGKSCQARTWLKRVESAACNPLHVPIIVCAHGRQGGCQLSEEDIRLLRRYPTAEYAYTSSAWPEGIKDCANRVVYRVRRAPTTPIRFEQ